MFLSDNGIVEEGVSQSGSCVTHSVAEAMAEGRSTVCVMAGEAGTKVFPVDIGMKGDPVDGITYRRIRSGTGNFLKEPAMTMDEVNAAIEAGCDLIRQLKEEGNSIILLGEMGIGNTTTATALSCALLSLDPFEVTGHGAGLDDAGLLHKCRVIGEALDRYVYDSMDTLRILSLFGGFDIAAMTGAIKAGAELHVPIVLDGLITLTAALIAERLYKGSSRVCIASHTPREAAGREIMKELDLRAPVDADLALGEGTGAVLLMPQLDVCMALYDTGSSFDSIGVESYKRYRSLT